jgi:galactose mutarotase-like enzyme
MNSVLSSNQITVTVKSAGAEITSVRSNEGIEFIWQANEKVWPRHAPVLFPIVGKLKNNRYTFGNHEFELPQHGFARDLDFIQISGNSSHCEYSLFSSKNTLLLYPFNFGFYIRYELKGNQLEIKYKVHNTDKKSIRFSVGAHPGFRCPITDGENFSDYFLEFESHHPVITELNGGLRSEVKSRLSLQGKKLHLTNDLFDKDALVFEGRQINKISLRSNKSPHGVKIECKGWPYFGIWSKKGSAEFVCLEPWFGIADHENASGLLNEKEGMISLSPDATFECSFCMEFL